MADSKLVGIDFAGICREVGEQLERELPERERRQKAAEARYDYESQHVYHLVVRPQGNRVRVESIEAFPLVGRLSAVGRNLEHAQVELRFAYANALVKNRLLPDLATARSYACKATFRVDVGSLGADSQGAL